MSGEASPATPASAVLALELLYDRVTARFEAEAPGAVAHAFGWRESPRQLQERARIVWIPGDPQGGLGAYRAPRRPGRNPLPLATLEELFTVRLWAHDAGAPDSERAQYRAARLLYDAWMRHVQRVVWDLDDTAAGTQMEPAALEGLGGISILAQRWDRAPKRSEGSLGAALLVVGAIPAMIPDESLTPAPADTSAEITTTLLDESVVDVSPEPEPEP